MGRIFLPSWSEQIPSMYGCNFYRPMMTKNTLFAYPLGTFHTPLGKQVVPYNCGKFIFLCSALRRCILLRLLCQKYDRDTAYVNTWHVDCTYPHNCLIFFIASKYNQMKPSHLIHVFERD
jgi:hypothetical protein